MVKTATTQSDLLCRNCGGQCAFEPAQQQLLCQSCGALWPIPKDENHTAAEEIPFDPDTPQNEPPIHFDDHVHQCETCGGEVVFTGPAMSENCPYCDGPVVLTVEELAYETMALIPFLIDRDDASRNIASWIKARLAAPDDLSKFTSEGRIAGLYAPFWTFDSREAVQYWASYTSGTGKSRRTRRTSGHMTIEFDDMLVPASDHVTPLIRDGILHDFRPIFLQPYNAGFLAGFAAERHHMTVADGLQSNADDKDILIRNKIKAHVGKPGTKVDRYRTDTTGIHYRRIMLPVWILHYTYRGTAKKVVVSGIDGRTFGERPFSKLKLAGYAAVLTSIAMLLGLVWGASGIF